MYGQLVETLEKLQQQIHEAAEMKKARSLSENKDEKQPKLGFVIRLIQSTVFAAIEFAAKDIKDELAREIVLFGVHKATKFVGILTDDEKDNLGQISKYLQDNWRELAIEFLGIAIKIVERFAKEGEIKAQILEALQMALEMAKK